MTSINELRYYGLTGVEINPVKRAGYLTIESLLTDSDWRTIHRVGTGIQYHIDRALVEYVLSQRVLNAKVECKLARRFADEIMNEYGRNQAQAR